MDSEANEGIYGELDESGMKRVSDLAHDISMAVRDVVRRGPTSNKTEIAGALAAAMSMLVAWESMQGFLETLAECAAAKEDVRSIDDGEVPDLH